MGMDESTERATGVRTLVVSIGNTNLSCAIASGADFDAPRRIALADIDAAADELASLCAELGEPGDAGIGGVVLSSVNARGVSAIEDALSQRTPHALHRIGRDVPLPIRHALSDEAIAGTGEDRLLNAVAAFDAAKQAVVVVDAGTAITVDFIDGKGVFQGGAIAPGVGMSLAALHGRTSALPAITPARPEHASFGINTEQAMLQGVYYGAQGLVRRLVERYAEAYDAYPMVVATGGDAALLFEEDELIDRVVPFLTLRGVAVACVRAAADADDA
jgi:type III pantothenate kinase